MPLPPPGPLLTTSQDIVSTLHGAFGDNPGYRASTPSITLLLGIDQYKQPMLVV